MNFHGKEKLLLMVSHALWARNQKIIFLGNWNPKAWKKWFIFVLVGKDLLCMKTVECTGKWMINLFIIINID